MEEAVTPHCPLTATFTCARTPPGSPGKMAKDFMDRVEKPWGYELIFAHTDRYVGKILHIEAGHRLSRQYHVAKDETLMVESGSLDLEVGNAAEHETIHMTRRDVFRITPGTIHRLIAVTEVDVIEVSTPELDDIVRLSDDYGREGTSAR